MGQHLCLGFVKMDLYGGIEFIGEHGCCIEQRLVNGVGGVGPQTNID